MTDQPFNLDTFLAQRAVAREAAAIEVDAELRIRRGSPTRAGDYDFEPRFTLDVWDDEYFTTLILAEAHPRPELLRNLFLDRKRAAGRAS